MVLLHVSSKKTHQGETNKIILCWIAIYGIVLPCIVLCCDVLCIYGILLYGFGFWVAGYYRIL